MVRIGEAGAGVVKDARARDLLAANFDVTDCALACYSATGFSAELRAMAGTGLSLISLADLYPS